jgi:hypothetical protein
MRFASLKRLEEEHRAVCERGTPTSIPSLKALSKQTLPRKGDAEMQNYVFQIDANQTAV